MRTDLASGETHEVRLPGEPCRVVVGEANRVIRIGERLVADSRAGRPAVVTFEPIPGDADPSARTLRVVHGDARPVALAATSPDECAVLPWHGEAALAFWHCLDTTAIDVRASGRIGTEVELIRHGATEGDVLGFVGCRATRPFPRS